MNVKRRTIAAAGVAVALGASALGTAVALGGNDDDEQATGPGADRAASVALDRFPGARVLAVEQDADSGPPWEVELRRPDGTTVDVELDARYRIVDTDEDDGPDDPDFDDP
jgi:uncharacterized membrane protein YkoI